MEPSRVELHNWPHNPDEAGGWVMPHGEPISRWKVSKVHARYVAPRIPFGAADANGRPLRPRGEYHAYLVDLEGAFGLEDYAMVLLHQVPPVGWWMIKPADDESLERIEKWRV